MLALKKKREAEAKVAAEEKAEADKMEVETPASAGPASAAAAGPAKVSLLGIGGKKKTTGPNGDSKTAGKKRSPGEIRIQKGAFSYSKTTTKMEAHQKKNENVFRYTTSHLLSHDLFSYCTPFSF
jgi:hypothetical protein